MNSISQTPEAKVVFIEIPTDSVKQKKTNYFSARRTHTPSLIHLKDRKLHKLQQRAEILAAAKELEWLDRQTAAAYAGLSTGTLDKLIKTGSIPSTRIQARVCIKRALLDNYMLACTTGRSKITV